MKSPLERIMEPRIAHACAVLDWSAHRQVRVGAYVLDFLVRTHRGAFLIVELDGAAWHERTEEQGLRDRQRDRFFLRSFGIPTIRFLGKEVLSNPQACITSIIQIASRLDFEQAPISIPIECAGRLLSAESPAASCWRCGCPIGEDAPGEVDHELRGEARHVDRERCAEWERANCS